MDYEEENKMKTKKIIMFIGFVILIFSVSGFCQNSKVDWYSFNMGYANPTGASTAIKSVVGQVFVGTTKSADKEIICGFLADTLLRGVPVAVNDKEGLPTEYRLNQNYPNPFNPSTTIRYELPERGNVEIIIYDLLGQQVAALVSEEKEAGRYSITWNGINQYGGQVSGIYFYRLSTKNFSQTKKFMLLK